MSRQRQTGKPGAEPLLAQDEIDTIISATRDDPPDSRGGPMAVDRLLYGRAVSYERLPMAEVVFERLARILAGTLRTLFQDNVEVRLANLASQPLADSFNFIGPMSLLGVFRAREWDNLGIIHVDADTVSNVTEILLGGRRVAVGSRHFPKPLTSISRNLTERLIRLILQDLTASFAPICAVSFDYERTETDPRFATIGRNSGAALTARLSLTTANRNCSIGIILPYATIEPVRELLLQQFMGEKFGRDSIWETHLAEELWHTDVELEAVLDEQTMTLGEIMNLREGDVMPIGAPKGSSIRLRCGSADLFTARLGIRHGRIAAELGARVERRED